jgi:hypothetical protein
MGAQGPRRGDSQLDINHPPNYAAARRSAAAAAEFAINQNSPEFRAINGSIGALEVNQIGDILLAHCLCRMSLAVAHRTQRFRGRSG